MLENQRKSDVKSVNNITRVRIKLNNLVVDNKILLCIANNKASCIVSKNSNVCVMQPLFEKNVSNELKAVSPNLQPYKVVVWYDSET